MKNDETSLPVSCFRCSAFSCQDHLSLPTRSKVHLSSGSGLCRLDTPCYFCRERRPGLISRFGQSENSVKFTAHDGKAKREPWWNADLFDLVFDAMLALLSSNPVPYRIVSHVSYPMTRKAHPPSFSTHMSHHSTLTSPARSGFKSAGKVPNHRACWFNYWCPPYSTERMPTS